MNTNVILGVLLSTWVSLTSAAQVTDVSVDRAWGLLIGDVINVTAELPVAMANIDQASIPQEEKRYGDWFYLMTVESDNKTITLQYQVTNVPTTTKLVRTPEFTLRSLDDAFITVPGLPISIGTLLPEGHDRQIKPDHKPVLQDTRSLIQQITIATVCTILFAFILVVWHVGWKFKHRRPFAQAVHDLNKLRWSRQTDPQQAARILHAAFNATADTIVVQKQLASTLDKLTWLQPLSDEINAFYQASEQHFFSREAKVGPEFTTVMKLAKACRAKEKLA
jgi:mxaA protein